MRVSGTESHNLAHVFYCISVNETTHGSGEWWGLEECLIYCVHWNTRNARLARKSRAVTSPAAGRSVNPDVSGGEIKKPTNIVRGLTLNV